jgi:hypothetical protein
MKARLVPIQLLLAGALALLAGCAANSSGSGSGQGAGAGGAKSTTGAPPAAPAGGSSNSPAPDSGSATNGAAAGSAATQTAAGAGAGAGNGPGQTSDERRAAIDKQLNDSLGSFDAQLRTEQQQVSKEHDTRQAAKSGSASTEQGTNGKSGEPGSASPEGPGGDADKEGHPRRGGLSKPRDHSGDLKSEKATKKPDDNAGNGATAREIPDGSDDDVVARRLRQAAEQETDPELKDRLWQEYIDYKKNAQSK